MYLNLGHDPVLRPSSSYFPLQYGSEQPRALLRDGILDLKDRGYAASLYLPGDVNGDIPVEATGPDGAEVAWSPYARDIIPDNPAVTCSEDSGSTFPIGTTTVTCSATDTAGNKATGSFDVVVRDTTEPVILGMPSDVTRTATDASGATVSYDAPETATDKVDGAVPVECSPAMGSTFPIGATTVSCSAEDDRGNRTTETFDVDVVYDFGNGTGGGFAEPVTDGQLNEVKAGPACR